MLQEWGVDGGWFNGMIVEGEGLRPGQVENGSEPCTETVLESISSVR